MKSEIYQEIDSAKMSFNWGRLKGVSLVFFLIGAAAFAYQLLAGDAQRAWSAYLTNYVYWTGLAFGTFLLSPVLVVTNATWGRPVKRLSESVVFFLPLTFILLWPLFLARGSVFWWVLHPEAQKAPWLNTPFFFAREGIGLLALALTAALITYHSVKSDSEFMQGIPATKDRERAQYTLSTAYAILYAFVLTLVAFDMMMSLNPEWFSTLFGAYYFAVSFYAGTCVSSRSIHIWRQETGDGQRHHEEAVSRHRETHFSPSVWLVWIFSMFSFWSSGMAICPMRPGT